jgi:hypothetical protein
MKHFSKLFPWFFGFVVTCILAIWILTAVLITQTVTTVADVGLKNVVEQVWCGKDAACKLPEMK